MMDIVLASANPGKIREFKAMMEGLEVQVYLQSEFEIPPVDETGTTFVENAIIKARHAAKLARLPAIADDSGLSVDALNGAPGVYSARYAGPGASDEANLKKLLTDVESVPVAERSCRFICVIAYLKSADDPLPVIATGVWEGSLLRSPRGSNGFGYDPIFYVPDRDCASAELDPTTKNRISHRAQALNALLASFRPA
ncbi:MAG: RdgB/HAM1 family non-canonical purine NTP pyrophosphatase [Gammaproteobacteria bacterium]|nr:RdgB/HAM1 family non-canonical purine NTP pyrophosphatase [Gammaproteobacteria bacterium]